jgi:hypothetical protein
VRADFLYLNLQRLHEENGFKHFVDNITGNTKIFAAFQEIASASPS